MDQLVFRDTSVIDSTYEPARRSALFNPVSYGMDIAIQRAMSFFYDSDLFYGVGGSLHAWRSFMKMLKTYDLVTVLNYDEMEKYTFDWIRGVSGKLSERPLSDSLFETLRSNSASLIDLSPSISKSSNSLESVSASEFIYIVLKRTDVIAKQDANIKKNLGAYLNHALNIERQEIAQIQEKSMSISLFKTDSRNNHLSYASNYDASISQKIRVQISKREHIEIMTSGSDGRETRLSPWYIAVAFQEYMNEQNLWGNVNAKLIAMYNQEQKQHLTSIQKRLNESVYKLALFVKCLPDLKLYEKKIQEKDVKLLKLMYNLPQIITWGMCIDRQALLDGAVQQNVRQVIQILKREIKEGFEGDIKDLEKILDNPEKYLTSKLSTFQEEFFRSVASNLKNGFYREFFETKQVIHTTIPLILSLFFFSEFESFSKLHTPPIAKDLVKYIIYGSFPLLLSIIYETQENIVSLLGI